LFGDIVGVNIVLFLKKSLLIALFLPKFFVFFVLESFSRVIELNIWLKSLVTVLFCEL